MPDRPTKITFAEMRDMGERGLLVYLQPITAAAHSIAISGDDWPDDVRLSDIEPRFVCRARGKRGPTCGPIGKALCAAQRLRLITERVR